MSRQRLLRSAACLLAAGLAAASASAQQRLEKSDCPQPRFTGSAPTEYLKQQNPLPQGADLSEARKIFMCDGDRLSCAKCHGEKGDGRGPMSAMFDPPPRNFACAQTVNGIPDGQIFWIVRFGSPGTSMPPHPKLTDEQIWKLVAYLRQLAR
jgi:mono/diheme cytochrome c family protein